MPSDSVIATIEGNHVLQVNQGQVISTPVTLGMRFKEMTVIEKGLDETSAVISQGQFQVKTGF